MGDLGGRSYKHEGEITPDEKTFGMLAHLLNLVMLIGPLIIWAIKKDQSRYVATQAMQAMYWGGAMWILWVVIFIISMVTCGVGALLYLPMFVVQILYLVVGTMKANEGLIYEYPITGKMVKV